MHPRRRQARESGERRASLWHGGGPRSSHAASAFPWRRIAAQCGLMVAIASATGCSGDDRTPTETAGAGGAAGTGGGGSGTVDAGDQDGLVICPLPGEPIDMYHANLVKAGRDRVLTFTLVESDNAPPSRGNNSWQLKITKMDQTPVKGEITPKIEMPHHTHPPSKAPEITYDAAKGLYNVTPVFLFMPGYWSAEFTAYELGRDAEAPLDRGTFYFCVD
jgi:hypothetical protein